MKSLKKNFIRKVEKYVYDVAISHVNKKCFGEYFEPKVPTRLKKNTLNR